MGQNGGRLGGVSKLTILLKIWPKIWAKIVSNYANFCVLCPKCPYLEILLQTPKLQTKNQIFSFDKNCLQYASNEPSMALIAYVALEICQIIQMV